MGKRRRERCKTTWKMGIKRAINEKGLAEEL